MKKLSTNSNGKNFWSIFLLLSFLLVIFLTQVDAQTLSVSGRVVSSRFPIQNVSISFIDNSDTTIKFTTLTNTSGNYQIDLDVTSVEPANHFPTKFELEQNYPNPFSSSTAIPYNISKQSDDIQVTIYDILGREVRKFAIGLQSAGSYNILWDGRNNFGQKVTNGIYLYKLQVGSETQVKKMVFNSGRTNFLSQPQINYSHKMNTVNESNNYFEDNTYTVRIENTENTSPIIIPKQFDNIQVNNDTTINFSVDYLPTVTIDFDSLHQIIRGFGGATPGYLPVMTLSEVDTAFGTDDGQIGLSILRIEIQPDSNLWARYLPSAKKAHDMGAIIIASPWNAPYNMVEAVNGTTKVRYDMYSEYAAYLNSFITYMKNNGVPIYGVSIQNEPESTSWTHWTPDEMLRFMKENAQVIEGTRVMDPESWSFKRSYTDPILNDSAACANTDIICGHIYGGGLGPYPLAEQKGKEVWMTEYLFGDQNSGNNWYWAMYLATNINAVMKADMSVYVWWTLVRYYGLIGDGTKAANPLDPNESYPAKGEVTKKGYVMSQFSKFIHPGYYRVESSVYPSIGSVDITAYKDSLSSKVVVVAVNSGSTEAETVFRIQNGTLPITFTPYTTSETKNCEQGTSFDVIGDSFTVTLEPSSITTFVLN